MDARLAAGEPVGPLAGVPCPIKDLNAVAGVPMEAGSASMAGFVPEISDDIVGWLAEAGSVCTGKTATPEFGLPCYTEPASGEPARTPWDLTRMAGGSSGGAAAAVAAGLAPIAQASDGGGSIRIPASCCGLVGLKASRGLISPGRGRPPGPGLVTDGLLSRTVADTALALDVLAGPRPGDTYFAPRPAGGFAVQTATRFVEPTGVLTPSPSRRRNSRGLDDLNTLELAERGGFEPPKRGLDAYTLSRRAPSTTRTPLRWNRTVALRRWSWPTGCSGRPTRPSTCSRHAIAWPTWRLCRRRK